MLNEKIKQLRLTRGLKQSEVANFLGIDFRQMSMIEKGKRKLTIGELVIFSELVGLTPNDILGVTKKPHAIKKVK